MSESPQSLRKTGEVSTVGSDAAGVARMKLSRTAVNQEN